MYIIYGDFLFTKEKNSTKLVYRWKRSYWLLKMKQFTDKPASDMAWPRDQRWGLQNSVCLYISQLCCLGVISILGSSFLVFESWLSSTFGAACFYVEIQWKRVSIFILAFPENILGSTLIGLSQSMCSSLIWYLMPFWPDLDHSPHFWIKGRVDSTGSTWAECGGNWGIATRTKIKKNIPDSKIIDAPQHECFLNRFGVLCTYGDSSTYYSVHWVSKYIMFDD